MKVSDLRGILTYIPGFREKTFVIALDGTIIADDNFPNLMLDLAVLRSLSIRLVIVHGAAHQIQELAKQSGVKISNADGTGITDAETLKLALTAANRITHEVLEGLASSDLRARIYECRHRPSLRHRRRRRPALHRPRRTRRYRLP